MTDRFHSNPDESEYELNITSKYNFFDLFGSVKEKIAIPIPETLLLKSGSLFMWVFNSGSQEPRVILKKKQAKLIITDGLAKIALNKSDQPFINIYSFIDYIRNHQQHLHSLKYFFKDTRNEGYITTADSFIRKYVEKGTDILYIQKKIDFDSNDE